MPVTQKPAVDDAFASLIRGTHRDPFAVLGPHVDAAGTIVVRAFQPAAQSIELRLVATGALLPMEKRAAAGLFEVRLDAERVGLTDSAKATSVEKPPADVARAGPAEHSTADVPD